MNQASILAALLLCSLASGHPALADPKALTILGASGESQTVKNFEGKWVLVNYWATWCSACIEEMPVLSALSVKEPRINIIGVTTEAITPDQLRLFLSSHPVSYHLGRADIATIPRELSPSVYGVQVRPISYLIAPSGSVVQRYIGTVDVIKLKLFVTNHLQ